MGIDKRNIEIIDDIMARVLREKTPQQRLAIAFNMWSSAQRQLTHYLHSIDADWDGEKVQQEAARRLSHGTT